IELVVMHIVARRQPRVSSERPVGQPNALPKHRGRETCSQLPVAFCCSNIISLLHATRNIPTLSASFQPPPSPRSGLRLTRLVVRGRV
ncbi:unnamed protein product, partial [Ceratitis capitata]